jgi:DtxR family Mn-dependent transcriptional regulator
MTSLTVENYLKAILQISIRTAGDWVSTGQLATSLGVSPGTVTSMVKSLGEATLVEYRPYEGVKLTNQGRILALRMLRRHRLIELFLVKTLNLTWDQVHEEAENMEHAVSDELIDRIDEYLGRPDSDPHGDPIPSSDGAMRGSNNPAIPLARLEPGTKFRIVRVTNQGGDFLRFLAETGLMPQTTGTLLRHSEEAGMVTVHNDRGDVSLGISAADQVLAERVE